MKKTAFIILILLSTICKAEIVVFGDGESVIWSNNSHTFSIRASDSMSESVVYDWPIVDGEPGQTIITDGAGVLSFADVNAVAGTHKLLSVTHTDATGDDVTRGSIIYGNSTPKWDELVIGTGFLKGDGTDITGWSLVTLATDTTGNYVATIADAGNSTVTVGNSGSESAAVTLDVINVADADLGDVTISSGAWAVEDDSHNHTGSTVSGIDISDDTNLVAGTNITLVDDTLNVDDAFLVNDASDTTTGTITAAGFTDGTATITGGDGTNFTSFVVDTITLNGTSIMTSGSMLIDTPTNDTGTVIQMLSDSFSFSAANDDFVMAAINGDITLTAGNDVRTTTSGAGRFVIVNSMRLDSGDFDLNGSLDVQNDLNVDRDTTLDKLTAVGDDGAAGVDGDPISLTGGLGGTGTQSEGGGPANFVLFGGTKGAAAGVAGKGGDGVWLGGTGGIGENADAQGGDLYATTQTARGGGFGDGTYGNLYLLKDGGNIRIGGDGVPTALVHINSAITGTILSITATGLAENAVLFTMNSNERVIQGTSDEERCALFTSKTDIGVQGSSTSGNGVEGTSVDGLAGRFTIDSATANTVLDVMEVRRRTTDGGFGVNGIGGRICYRLENDSGSTQIAVGTDAVMSDVTTGSEITEYRISVRDGLNGLEQLYTFQHDLFTVGNTNTATGIKVGNPTVYFTSETDGDTFWVGAGTGLVCGHMNIPGVDVTVDTSTGTDPCEVLDDGTTSADDGWASTYQNEVTFAVGDLHYQTVTIAGTYKVIWDMSPKTAAGGGTVIHGGITIDSTTFVRDNGEGHAHVFNANDNIQLSGVGVVDCPNGNEEISLWISNNAAQKTIIEHGNMIIELIGGT